MKWLLTCFLCFTYINLYAQINKDDPHKVDPILTKLAEIDVANQILPLVLTKDQINKLLPIIEKCRQNVRQQEASEARRIKELQPEIDKVYDEIGKAISPSETFLAKINLLFETFEKERQKVLVDNGAIILANMKEILNEGQKKAAINVVDKVYNEITKTWEEGTDEMKLQFFSVKVLLNERAYDLLVRLREKN